MMESTILVLAELGLHVITRVLYINSQHTPIYPQLKYHVIQTYLLLTGYTHTTILLFNCSKIDLIKWPKRLSKTSAVVVVVVWFSMSKMATRSRKVQSFNMNDN